MNATARLPLVRTAHLYQGVQLLSSSRCPPMNTLVTGKTSTQVRYVKNPLRGAYRHSQVDPKSFTTAHTMPDTLKTTRRFYTNTQSKKSSRVPISIDGKTQEFSPLLLRDFCQCPLCVHESTNQRLFSTADIPATIQARSVEIDSASQSVNIKWDNDAPGYGQDHTTNLSMASLREIVESGSLPGLGRDKHAAQVLWTTKPLPNLRDFDYDEYMKNDEEVYKLIHQLRTDGLAFVTNVPGKVESLATIAERIGPVQDTLYGRTWDVRTIPQAINAAYTSADLGFHTDLLYFQNPPHIQLLHCIQSASKGGASVFADAYKSAVDLFHQDPETFETLATVPVNYHYNHPNDNVYRTTKPVIDLRPLQIGEKVYSRVQDYAKDYHELSTKNGGSGWSDSVLVEHMLKINWGPPFLAPFSNHQDPLIENRCDQSPLSALNDKIDAWHSAAFKFNALLQRPEYLFERKMNPGDCVLFDNTRTLHSRRAFDMADVGKPRWLRGTYVDKDSYFSRTRVEGHTLSTLRGLSVGGPEQPSQETGAPNAKTDGCENCAKFGCPCPGYTQKLRWSHKHQRDETLISKETTFGRDVQPQVPLPVIQVENFDIQAGSAGLHNVLDTLPDESVILNDDYDYSWLSETAASWQATGLDIGVDLLVEPPQDPFNSSERPEEHDLTLTSNPRIIQAPVHISTTLIEYWFRYICPVRSTFDSDVNNNRSLARDSWATSEAVFYTMQVMSAVCLVDTMPHLRQTLPTLREQSTLAITQGISQVRNLGLSPVTADLVFAVLARGTSSHWITPGNLDYSWLESARELLFMWNVGISASDALVHAYFCQALAYWEMLLALVGRGSNTSIIEKKRQKYQDKLHQAMLPEEGTFATISHPHLSISSSFKPLGTLPNSWCGISNEVIETFGQILALCRSACDYNQDQRTVRLEIASKALCDIAVARELEKELLSMDFNALVLLEELQGFYVDTRDDNTPVSHLLETAEAYRKAGLLQLYLTFDDLAVNANGVQNAFANGCNDAGDKTSREIFLMDLTLQLVATLERIPAESGSKFIHPMLYVSAAAGLKFQRYPDPQCPRTANNDLSDIFTSQLEWDLLDLTSVACLPGSSDTISAFVPQSVLKIEIMWLGGSVIVCALRISVTLAKSRGDAAAVRYLLSESSTEYKTVTYAEYCNDVEYMARAWLSVLSHASIAKGAVVGIWMRGWSYQDLLNYLSLQRAGFIPQLFSLRMTNPAVVYELLDKSNAAALIYDASCESLVKDCPLPTFTTEMALEKAAPRGVELEKVTTALNGDQVSVIFHTSGSTSGMPKLVPATVKWMDCLIRKNRPYTQNGPQPVYCLMGSHAHLGNTINLAEALANAGCLIPPKSIPYPTSELQSMITHGGLTALNIFPALLSVFIREARTDTVLLEQLQSLQHIFHAGQVLEPSDQAWAHQQGIKLINTYGSTEIGLSMRASTTSQYLTPFPESGCEFIPLVGNPSSSDQLLELVIPADADDCPHPSLRDKSDGKFHTGDLFQRVGDDQYFYKGRVDDRIKMQLSLVCDAGSLEAEAMQVCQADLISAISVIGSGHPSPAIIVEPKNDDILKSGDASLMRFKEEILRRISPFHARKYLHERIDDPRLVFVVPQGTLPRTAKGNVMRKSVETMFFDELEKSFRAVLSA
ncbi:4-hydroxybenzoate benzoate ligase [Fusarium sp. NRRL 52700]|nr:4-hydroxybenzoate benzoate ligase [Fusarium sp. NRRL 52700]